MKEKVQRKRVPQRIDGVESKNKLKISALELFSQNNFADVSISQIAKNAALSTAAFYQYYLNKDELFREIVEEFLTDVRKEITGHSLYEVGLRYFEYCSKNKNLVHAIYLNEYHFEWLRNDVESILKEFSSKFGLTEVGHFYFWSPIRFAINFGDLLDFEVKPETFIRLLEKGLSNTKDLELPKEVFEFTPIKHILETDERREMILANAESLFGSYGFQKTQVYDIARASGVAVGTVYLYFENKREILRELVRWISKGLRFNVKNAVKRFEGHPRLVQEIAGLYAFLQFFRSHTNMYKVVRESQSLDLDISKEYYVSIFKPYCVALRNSLENGTLSLPLEIEFVKDEKSLAEYIQYVSLILMGIGHYLGEYYLLSGKYIENEHLKTFLQDLYLYLCNGFGGVRLDEFK
ncbi:TetR/AcrR family transcriptional regulator [Fervidobacterium sp.]